MKKLIKAIGRLGRSWWVYCWDCDSTNTVESDSKPTRCPDCDSSNISVR